MPIEKVSQVIEYRFSRPSSHWLLPLYASQAYEINQDPAVPAISSLIAIQTAILLIDDLLDNDGRREALGLSVGDAANVSSVFQAVSIDCLAGPFSRYVHHSEMIRQINQVFIETALGQYLDNENPETEDEYWRAARAKSCPFFGLAFYLGAAAGGAPWEQVETMQRLGRLYGEMIQIHDDLSDCLSEHCGSDWLLGKFTLPILFARTVQHPERERFTVLMKNITDPGNFHEAKEILLHCGAISYCLNEVVQRHTEAMGLLTGMMVPNPAPLILLLDDLIQPISNLLDLKVEYLS